MMEKEETGFSIVCNWCGHTEILVRPINNEVCVMECLNEDCQETVHFMNIK